jgi:ABC-2 type transport system permease protein
MAINNTLHAWYIIAKNNLQRQLLTRSSALLFVVGKLLTFVFSLLIIISIFTGTGPVKGYTLHQAVIFILVFFVIESVTQFLFRSIYSFRYVLLRGDFDLDLLKPLPTFFRPLLAGPDFFDLPPLLIHIFTLFFFLAKYNIHPAPLDYLSFFLLLLNGIFLAFSVYLLIAAFSITTTEVDNLVWLYRSLSDAARVPVDIYPRLFQIILTGVIPVAVIIGVPARALLGILEPQTLLFSLLISLFFVYTAFFFWQRSLKHYSSASS